MHRELIEAILEAPLADQQWSPLFPALQTVVPGMRCMIRFGSTRMRGPAKIMTNEDGLHGGLADMYREVYQYKDPVPYNGLTKGQLYRFEDLIDRRSLAASEFYSQFCEPNGMTHAFFCYLGEFNGVDAWLNGVQDKPFSTDEWNELHAAQRFVSMAAKYFVNLEHERVKSFVLAEAFDQLSLGVVLLDERCRVLAMNPCADAMLRTIGREARVGEPMQLPDLNAEQSNAHPRWAESSTLPQPDVMGRAGDLHIAIRAVDVSKWPGAARPSAIIHLKRDLIALSDNSVGGLMRQFGLSRSEAQVALLLANGLALPNVAAHLGITLATVRTYCKRVLSKTGTTRQSELIRLIINRLPLWGSRH